MTAQPERRLRRAKDRIARALLAASDAPPDVVGELTLRRHQATAVGRLLEMLRAYRGALLADAVGLGKTYVALAIARDYGAPLIVCPSALRSMWQGAAAAARLEIPIITTEALSRGAMPDRAPDLLIVDEAHHLRTPGTRRYEALSQLARHASVLLLSATPLHNSRRDLSALLALFAGSGVRAWSDEELARLIVRRDEALTAETLPRLDGPTLLSPGSDDDCVDAILGVPPTIPAADEGEAHALTTISLLHLWASSRAALVASVKKRLARAIALRDAVTAGHLPTGAELSAWRFSEDALQLAFPLFTDLSVPPEPLTLQSQLDRFIDAAESLLDHCRASPDPDEARVALLRDLRDRHPGERIVAFSQYANTVDALGRLMRNDRGIALITADAARIASGPIARDEVLSQFAAGKARARPLERIELLLTTDLLSEGIDLRGASVIVHLDLPWNPARMEQRVGRARRMGSPHPVIRVFTLLPPAAAERMLELRKRLMAKMRHARDIVGPAFDPFGDAQRMESLDSSARAPVAVNEALRARLSSWIDPSPDDGDDTIAIGAARSSCGGWIAAVVVGGLPRLVACVEGVIEDACSADWPALVGTARPIDPMRRDAALGALRDWLATRDASALTSLPSSPKRALLERLSRVVAVAPRHRRPRVIAVAQRARALLDGIHGVGHERAMAGLASSALCDDAWVQALDEFAAGNGADVSSAGSGSRVLAVILLDAISAAGDATPG